MKKIVNIILVIVTIVLLNSCKEEFKNMDVESFNSSIADYTDINSIGQLISIYYNFPENEGEQQITVTEKHLRGNMFQATLIHDNQADDSVRAVKIILVAEQNGSHWKVLEIKKNWKCYEGRGHSDWGIEYCK